MQRIVKTRSQDVATTLAEDKTGPQGEAQGEVAEGVRYGPAENRLAATETDAERDALGVAAAVTSRRRRRCRRAGRASWASRASWRRW